MLLSYSFLSCVCCEAADDSSSDSDSDGDDDMDDEFINDLRGDQLQGLQAAAERHEPEPKKCRLQQPPASAGGVGPAPAPSISAGAFFEASSTRARNAKTSSSQPVEVCVVCRKGSDEVGI